MKSIIHFIAALTGLTMAGLAFIGGLILLKTTAWEVAEIQSRIYTGALLILSGASSIMIFVHLVREGRVSGIVSAVLLFILCAYPLAMSFHYLFIGPSYGGLIGGVGAAIALAQFLISLIGTLSGMALFRYSLSIKNEN